MTRKDKLVEFIQMVLKRPAMFQVNRVEDLSLLLFGYQHCLLVNSENDTADILGEFKKY